MSGLPVEVSVSVKADVLKLLEQNGITLEDFIAAINIKPPVSLEVLALGACKMTGSLESVEAVRTALKAEMQKISTVRKTNTDSSQFHSAFSKNEFDKAESSDIKTKESKLESIGNSDLIDVPASSSSVNEVGEKRQKRVRILKPSEPKSLDFPPLNPSTFDSNIELQSEGRHLLEKNTISQAASVKDVHTNEEIIGLVKAGRLVGVNVEKEHHNYIMMQSQDEINKYFNNIFEYEEDGKHKVALEPKVNTRNSRTEAVTKYTSYMDHFGCEIYKLPISVESSVMESIARVAGIEHVSVVVCEESKICKLLGSKKDIESMKSQIEEQLDYGKKQDDQWQCASAKKKSTKKPTYNFVIKGGKALSTNLPKSGKKSSLEVKFIEWKNDISVEGLVVAVDKKMNYDKDKRTIHLPTDHKQFLDSKNLSLMELVPKEAPKNLKKVRKILHIVLLETFDTKAETDVESRLKDGITECINYAEREKLTSLAIPHLCPGFYDVDAFIHQALEALKCYEGRSTKKSASLNSVIFVAKDSSMKQEMAEKFASLTDEPDD